MGVTRNQARAVLYGLACGDALGWPTEFMGMNSIFLSYGKDGITDLSLTDREFTDDTQMSVALAEGLLDAHKAAAIDPNGPAGLMDSPGWVMPYVARRFVDWAFSKENNRSPGSSCMGGCRTLRTGVPWHESGVPGALGCGSVMRVAPIGLLYSDEDSIKKIAEASAITTHASEPAARSAHLGALAIRMALDGRSAEDIVYLLIEEMLSLVTPETQKLHTLLVQVLGSVHATTEGQAKPWMVMDYGEDRLGQSWVADEALASALYCVCLAEARGEGYVEAVRYGANTPGDSDSIACIAGGIAGALWGLGSGIDGRGVPAEWVDMIEKSAYLGDLADRLADASAGITK